MQAAVTRRGRIVVDEVADPVPAEGHVLVRPLAAGICGSDLHALDHLDQMSALMAKAGASSVLDPNRDLVFGHEYCAEIVGFGPSTERTLPVGTRVCAVPTVFDASGAEPVGYSHRYPGAFAELMVLQELLLVPVPDDVPVERAALTEPMAVGEHAVALARLERDSVCVVLGCGPVGLAVIAALKARGHGPVIATDFSPMRRRLAQAMGADEVLDAAQVSPFSRWADLGVPVSGGDRMALEAMGLPVRSAVVFEAVGVPGVLQQIVEGAPAAAQVVVVGVCMQDDRFEPSLAIVKELEVRFAFGYRPEEYAATLTRIASGALDVTPLVTGTVGLDGVAGAFADLRHPDEHAKILVRPGG